MLLIIQLLLHICREGANNSVADYTVYTVITFIDTMRFFLCNICVTIFKNLSMYTKTSFLFYVTTK